MSKTKIIFPIKSIQTDKRAKAHKHQQLGRGIGRKRAMAGDGYLPLFETKSAKGRILHKLYAVSVFVGICLICIFRVKHLPAAGEVGRWAWIGLFMAELWFSFYWFITQFARWNPIYRYTFKERLSQRYEETLPGVDIFVCTADPTIEPPIMVINTVLSVMAYDYPPEKMSIYLSDDGGSELTFFALLEASHFSKFWLPFCNKYKIEPRSPAAFFSMVHQPLDPHLMHKEWLSIKKLYEDMKNRIEKVCSLARVPEEIRNTHKGFGEWEFVSSRNDHHAIVQILIDGRDPKEGSGEALPSLVYVAREKRPRYHHNFKAGAMNTLIRVSSKISNGAVILNVDCDMYSNNSESVRDALCFFMDEEKGQNIAYVQYPQNYDNLTKHDIYGSSLLVINEVELAAMDANGGPCYIGSGCFHRRDTLCGMKYSKECRVEWKRKTTYREQRECASVLEEACKNLASCTHEDNTQWGKEMGLKYGFPVEDIVTGLSIKCRGWKSIYFNPGRKGFTGVAPTTLLQALVQHKRWSEGQFKIALSKCSPFLYGHKKITFQLQFLYYAYGLWAPNCLPTLYFLLVPSLCLLREISLFPKIWSFWVLPFAYVIIAKYAYSLGEFICCGGTLQGWWNDQRMWMFKRTSSYLFAFIEIILNQLGFAKLGFVVTAKVAEDDVSQRYWKGIIEFGSTSPMFTILGTLAVLNLFGFLWEIKRVIMNLQIGLVVLDEYPFGLQIVLCGLVVFINLPVYQGLFLRKDKGSMPPSVTCKSVMLALLASSIAIY